MQDTTTIAAILGHNTRDYCFIVNADHAAPLQRNHTFKPQRFLVVGALQSAKPLDHELGNAQANSFAHCRGVIRGNGQIAYHAVIARKIKPGGFRTASTHTRIPFSL